MTDHLTSEQLLDLLDNVLPEDVRRDVEAHLSTCNRCASQLKLSAGIESVARALPRTRTSADFTARTMDLIPAEAPITKRGLIARRAIRIGVALSPAALYSWYVLSGDQPASTSSGSHIDVPLATLSRSLAHIAHHASGLFNGGTWSQFAIGLILIALLVTLDKAFLSKTHPPKT